MKGRAKCRLRALYDACAVANIPSGVLGTKVNPDTCRISLDGHSIRFEYAGNVDVDVEIFESEKKEFRIKNIYIYIYIFNNYSPKAKLILLNNPRAEVEGIIQQY